MNKYKVLKTIGLSFFKGNDQQDYMIDPIEGQYLESDGSTIWLINNHGRFESITTANAIDLYLERKWIELM